ncbi:MAG: hypothetical protein AAGA31_13325 [Bacteroidota bacterium]
MEDGEQYLSENASGAEREAADAVLRGLQALRLEEKVRAVAAERQAQQRWWRRLLFGGLALLSAAVFGWFYWTDQDKTPPAQEPISELDENLTPTETATALDTLLTTEPPPAPAAAPAAPVPIEKTVPPPTEPPPEETATDLGPIAQAQPWDDLADPRYPAPQGGLRGNTSTEKDARADLMNALWYTDYPLTGLTPTANFAAVDSLLRERNFPRAFIELNRLKRKGEGSDTLTYLTAYTFLELGRGAETVALLDQLKSAPAAWGAQMEWYRGLALLQANQDAAGREVLQRISSRKAHPYYREASKALFLLE